MKNYYFYFRTIFIKFIFKLIPINFFLSIIDILSIKESENLFIDAVQVSNSLKWDNQKIRFNVWDKYLSQNDLTTQKIQFFEFGVYEGLSIKYFAKKLTNENNTFIGYDTFYGLPTNWQTAKKGLFSTDGKFPKVDDKRIKFVKGLFQESFDSSVIEKNCKTLVHFDADMYSSTLFLLFKLHEKLDEYYFIFDEFEGEELRALKDYMKVYNVNVKIDFFSKFNGLVTVATGIIKTKI